MKLHSLAVHHIDRDATGTKMEPEQQVVEQIGSTAVRVNLGVPDFVAGASKIQKALDPNVATLASKLTDGGGLLKMGRIERQVSAAQAAAEATTQCGFCRNWDYDSLQEPKKHKFGAQGVADSRIALARGYMQTGMFEGLGPQEAQAEAEAMARASGICHAMQDQDGKDMLAPIHFRCHKFRPRGWLERRKMGKKYDEIMFAAGGGKGLSISGAGGAGSGLPSEKK